MNKALLVSGGAAGGAPSASVDAAAAGPSGFGFGSAWGVVSVVFILMNAVKRLAPIALQPFSRVREGGGGGGGVAGTTALFSIIRHPWISSLKYTQKLEWRILRIKYQGGI